MDERLQQYEYLWDGSQPQWALLSDGTGAGYLIVNTVSKMGKIIEDDVLAQKIIEKMLATGVRVVSIGNGF
ncbi:hypothetical protein [Paraburkholderia sp. MM5477-R1]|uniref:hypothetical protein n=1 Tax=Paraburkholderia sp. MM5477-R1 TaxID=2991062 RepID=UPI003D24F845